MYASVRQYKMDPGSVDELMRRVNEGFVPIISQGSGFMAYYVPASDVFCGYSSY